MSKLWTCTILSLLSVGSVYSSCEDAVQWAKETGIKSSPATYPGLTPTSSEDEFREFLRVNHPTQCPPLGLLPGVDFGTIKMNITDASLKDKIAGYFIGQLVGNFMGLPFEFTYYEDPIPVEPQTYYSWDYNPENLKINNYNIPQRLKEIGAAYTDDDTDIEFVTLYGVEKYGLNISFPEITEMWKRYINEWIWVANRAARDLMSQGVVAPDTGINNKWWAIDPQLVNEIWSAFYFGDVEQSVTRAEWGARITSLSYATHPTRFYAALYAGAFFTTNVTQLWYMAMEQVPEGIFLDCLVDIETYYKQGLEWRETRRLVIAHYKTLVGNLHYDCDWGFDCYVTAYLNGAMGAIAYIYGEGDFKKTMGIAIAAGFDADNQPATLGGVLGVMYGASVIPEDLTILEGSGWTRPFNDFYKNERRPNINIDYNNYNEYYHIQDGEDSITNRIFRMAVNREGVTKLPNGDYEATVTSRINHVY